MQTLRSALKKPPQRTVLNSTTLFDKANILLEKANFIPGLVTVGLNKLPEWSRCSDK